MTALAEMTAIADFKGLTVFSAIYVVYCNPYVKVITNLLTYM